MEDPGPWKSGLSTAPKATMNDGTGKDAGLILAQLTAHDIALDGVAVMAIGGAPVLCHELVHSFPSTAESYPDSAQAKLIPKLATYMHFTLSELLDEQWLSRTDDLRLATVACDAFRQLAHARFTDIGEEDDEVEGEQEFDLGLNIKVKTQKQSQKTRASAVASIDPKPFQTIGYSVPRSPAQANEMATNMLEDVRELLANYLDVIQLPQTLAKIAAALEIADLQADDHEEPSATSSHALTAAAPSALPEVSSPDIAFEGEHDLRAALDFDLPAELGDWHVYLSSHAYRDIRKTHREDKSRYKIIVAKIQQLSNGHFSNDNQKRLTQTGARVPIYEAKLTRDSRLVYQVDCVADAKNPELERQVIRLYGVYTHAQMDDRLRSIFDAIGVEVGRRGKEYQRRCVFRLPPVNAGDNVFSPATFPLGEDVLQKEYEDVQLPPEDKARVHELIKLEKYFLFSQTVLKCIVADIDAAHVFHLTDKEREIVGHAGSCYVLGRSGTGKTTTMLYKMLGIERAQRINGEGTSRTVRQLFVTQSHVLVEKVQEAYDKLAKSLHVEVSSKQDLMALKEERPGTRRDYLIKNDTKTVQKEMSVQRFSELTDQHFPLFLTYDKLCTLLEGDVLPSEERLIGEDFSDLTPRIMQRTGQLVTYRLFFTEYWPHFSQTLTKGLDPALVFSEIMGVIKGSEEASALPSHYLSLEGYENLSRRRQSTFASCRNVVYDIFVQYEKEKARRGDYDAADRTFNVLRILRGQGTAGGKIDYLYVDEVQDNLLIDARVLRHITRFANGLFWAGDTAQTISVGSAFRFNDLKAYLHRLEEEHNSAINRRPPRSFQLTTNYRSHAGIVDCAQTVIDLISTNWPDSIDQLAREEGEVAGVKPVFLTGWSSDTLCYEQFLFTSSSGNAIEFGAKQCILVRHEEARQRLRSRVGDISLIMTLYESKGLEFDDVVLYDFFQDSLVTASKWRMVLNFMHPDYQPRIHAPQFEETLHAGVCSELKVLYVAITRARKNVWIIDTSERAEPMRLLLTSWGRIESCTPANAPRLAVMSTPQEWEEEGIEMFKSEHYDQARFCYERAGMRVESAIAQAYNLRETASLMPSDGPRDAIMAHHKAFAQAADAFVRCAETARTSGYLEREQAYYRAAGDAWVKADDDARAANAFVKAGDFSRGAQLYRKVGDFEKSMHIVRTHGAFIDAPTKAKLINVARLHHFQVKEYRKAINLFDSPEDALQYLADTPFNVEKATLLESAGKFHDAAALLQADDPLHAVDLFLRATDDGPAIERAESCVSEGLWQHLPLGADVEKAKEKPLFMAYLTRARRCMEANSSSPRAPEFRMFHALVKHDLDELKSLARPLLDFNNAAAAFRCLRAIYHPRFPDIGHLDEEQLIDVLSLYKEYARLLHDLAFDPASCDKASVCRVFGIQRADDNQLCFVPRDTFVHEKVTAFLPAGTYATDDGAIVPATSLTRLLSVVLQSQLHLSLVDEEERCQHASVFRVVCLRPYLPGERCAAEACTRIHPDPHSLDARWYNRQVHLHLLQISILGHDIKELRNVEDRSRYRRFWINKLYETLFPATTKLGTVLSLSEDEVPAAKVHLQQVKYWCQDLLRAGATVSIQTLRTVLRVAHLSYTFDRVDASRYLSVAPALGELRAQRIFHRDGQYVVAQLLVAMEGEGAWYINAGVSFVRHVVEVRLSIDISALCDFCEYLAGCFVLGRSPSGFDNVTLPKSWLPALVDRFGVDKALPETVRLPEFIQALSTLLNVLYNGAARARYLIFEGKPMSDSTIIRGLFIGRICRMLCAICYNRSRWADEQHVRADVWSKIRSVFNHTDKRQLNFEQYMRAGDLWGLMRAYEESANDHLMDEVITLKLERPVTPVSTRTSPVPRQVLFTTVRSILGILGSDFFGASHAQDHGLSASTAKSRLREARTSAADRQSTDGDPREATETSPSPVTAVQKVVAYRLLCAYRRRTKNRQRERTRVATIIQRWYRRLITLRSLSGLDRVRGDFFAECMALEKKVKVSFPRFRVQLLYRHVLPRILTCLDVVVTHLESVKTHIRQEFEALDHHEKLETISDKLEAANAAIRKAKALASAIGPRPETYSAPDCLSRLQEHTRTLVAMTERLPPARRLIIASDLEVVVFSVLTYEDLKREKRVEMHRKKAKPTLNTYDDEYGQYYF